MNYSRRQLEALGEPLGDGVTRVENGRTIYGAGGGGGSQNVTQTTSNIPNWLRPQTEATIGAAMQQLFQTTPVTDSKGNTTYQITGMRPYVPYSANPEDYVAGFSPLQRQVQANAANLQVPGQFQQGTQLAGAAGQGAMMTPQQAMMYGQAGYGSGALGQQFGLTAAQQAAAQSAAAQNAAYGYGAAGYGAGMRGQSIGAQAQQDALSRAAMATEMARQSGAMGQQSGLLGQQIGVAGGDRYGGMGASYGAQASALAPGATRYGQQGATIGGQAVGLVPRTLGYGAQGLGFGSNAANIGMMGLQAQDYGMDVGQQARNYANQAAMAGQNYAMGATDPYAVQSYMSPYVQNVINAQMTEAQRQADIASQQRGSQFARAGAFGGARQAIENAEAARNLSGLKNQIVSQGMQNAFQNAQQAQQFGANLGLQGLAGAQAGLGTALQGGQLGLSGIGQAIAGQQAGIQGAGMGLQGIQTANQLYGTGLQGTAQGLQGLQAANQLYSTGIQGAGLGLQGVNQQLAGTAQGMQGAGIGLSAADRALAAGQLAQQGAQTGLSGTGQGMQGAGVGLSGVGQAINAGQLGLQGAGVGLQGTGQGMQGAGVGLQGVQGAQAGYGLGGNLAQILGGLGTQQLAGQTGILGLQNQIGNMEQQQVQNVINQAISNYAQAQGYPMQQIQQMSGLLRGYALPGQTITQYQAPPSMASQLGSVGLGAYGISQLAGMGKKKGGQIKTSGIEKLALRRALKGGKA